MPQDMMYSLESMVGLGDLLAYYPNPEDPDDPWGPIGPVANIWQRLIIAALNPQPLPPREGPHPDPWRAVHNSRAVINQAVIRAQMAELSGGDIGAYQESFRGNLNMLVDWWCGTPPRKWPFPWPPPPWWHEGFRPDELVLAGLQFRIAAGLDTPFQSEFADAAARLMETGMGRM